MFNYLEIVFNNNDICANHINAFFYIIYITRIIQYIVPIILLIWGSINLIKSIKLKKKKNTPVAIKPFIIKLIIAAIVFLLPWILYIIFNPISGKNERSIIGCLVQVWDNQHGRGVESSVWKPIIYIYPKEEKNITITVPKKDNLVVSYPKYINGWNVKAYPDGTLIDNNTGRELYSLYYEANYEIKADESTGFIVKGKDIIPFLEEKLSILGLNEREADEFIIYWLPILENNKYNYIYFATNDELNESMPLEFSSEPDTLIRILMMYKPLDKKIKVKEQKLIKTTRSGYSIIEWGGTQIK